MSDKSSENNRVVYSAGNNILTFDKPLVMAIVNITPDSFYDGGKYSHVKDVLHDIEEKLEQGADVIDLGAASSRPGAKEIDVIEEWNRLEPVLKAIRKQFPKILLSIDTYRSEIAKKSADCGANIINDISGGKLDKDMFTIITQIQLPYILMHMQGTPQNMQNEPSYENVTEEINSDLKNRIEYLNNLNFNKIIVDPGFGFGKTTKHNFNLLKELKQFVSLGYPVMVGISRKSMINKVIHTNPVTALNGTTTLHTIALLNGASILRVHDVTEARQAIELVKFYENV